MNALDKIRNVGVIAHIDAGKTTTTEAMLFLAGRTHRRGEVDSGNTVTDYLEEERERGITIVSAAASFQWKSCLVHLIDTPGHIDFTAEVERSLRVIDGAIVIFSGVEGVEAQSEKVWRQADHYNLPRVVFINKLDRIGSSFNRVLHEVNSKFGNKAIAFQAPLGVEKEFSAVIDLISMQLITVRDGDMNVQFQEIPEYLKAEAQIYRDRMIENLADFSDSIAERFVNEEVMPKEVLESEVRQLVLNNRISPVVIGSAKKSIGIYGLMDAIAKYLPSPADFKGVKTYSSTQKESRISIIGHGGSPLGLIFKVIARPSADLYYFRTYAGRLKTGANLLVPRTGKKVRIKRILRLYADSVEPIDEVGPGDIVGLIGPKDLVTGDTLCDPSHPSLLESIKFPEPVLSVSIEPYSGRDKDRLNQAMVLMCREDPTLKAMDDKSTGQSILSGMGELHLEINLKRIIDEFNIKVRYGKPRVEYRETIIRKVTSHAVFEKVVGDNEIYAEVVIELDPKPYDSEQVLAVDNKISDPTIRAFYIQSTLKYLEEGVRTGGNSGYPLIYVNVTLLDLKIHSDKTTEGALLGAVLKALDQAIKEAGTKILEPVMKIEVYAAEKTLGDLSNYLNARRARIHDIIDIADMKKVYCEVPLAEMFGFSKALPALTGGRGTFSMEPSGFIDAINTG